MGEPSFLVNDENTPINFIYDNTDSEYSYRLYTD